MKTYEKLTKNEKEKLQSYLLYMLIAINQKIVAFAIGTIIFAISIPILLIFTLPIIFISGYILMIFGLGLVIASGAGYLMDKKYLFLIYGYKNLYSDIFKVKKSDIRKIKIIKEVIWKKE